MKWLLSMTFYLLELVFVDALKMIIYNHNITFLRHNYSNITVKHTRKGGIILLGMYDDILTVDEVCEILKIGKNNVYAMLRAGELPAIRIGHIWRIPKSTLSTYILQMSSKTK